MQDIQDKAHLRVRTAPGQPHEPPLANRDRLAMQGAVGRGRGGREWRGSGGRSHGARGGYKDRKAPVHTHAALCLPRAFFVMLFITH